MMTQMIDSGVREGRALSQVSRSLGLVCIFFGLGLRVLSFRLLGIMRLL